MKKISVPVILHVVKNGSNLHFIVCFGKSEDQFLIADPAEGVKKMSDSELIEIWKSSALLTVSTTDTFSISKRSVGQAYGWIMNAVKQHINLNVSTFLLGLLVTFLSLVTAIFTEKLIDVLLPSGDNIKVIIGLVAWSTLLLLKSCIVYMRQFGIIKPKIVIRYFF